MRLDHVSYGVGHDELRDVVDRFGTALGAPLRDGGCHPRFGTRNFVLPLAGGSYLEVVAALDHPATERAPFGRAVRRRADAGGGWLAWVVAVDDIRAVERRLGRPSVEGYRHRPDGVELHWRQIGVLDVLEDPQLPFFVQWQVPPEQHPSVGARDHMHVSRLELSGDPAAVSRALGRSPEAALPGVVLDWVGDGAERWGLVAVHVVTWRGPVRLT